MSSRTRQFLHTPQGTESFFPGEACRHRQLSRMTEHHFESWGYLPVLTPIFDYFDPYRPLLNRVQEERSYRFPDRKGELLMLRSDITLFLAKQLGLSMKNASLPQRVHYADSIIRHQEDEDISSDEFFQSGVELIGLKGMDGDLEVLMLLHDLLSAMQLPPWRMHIGSRAVLDAVLDGKVDVAIAGSFLEIRDSDGLYRLLKASGLNSCRKRTELLLFLGTSDEFPALEKTLVKGISPDRIIRETLEELKSLASALSSITSMEHIRLDLSEHGGQPYYTGFTVKVYVEGANSAVASGGRYDNLLGFFGFPAPAAGFSLMMRKIEPLSLYVADVAEKTPISIAQGAHFPKRYRNAVMARKTGQRVAMS